MDLQLRQYEEDDWEKVRKFHLETRGQHPFCQKNLFDWQFRGFGDEKKKTRSLVLLDNGKVIGFRGIIPGLYQVPSGRNGMDILPGGSLAFWTLMKEYRGQRLGFKMHQEAQTLLNVISGAGSDPKTSVPIYLKNGFSVLDSMNRFIMPLNARGFEKLLAEKVEIRNVQDWVDQLLGMKNREIYPSSPDIDAMASVWEETTFPLQIFSLYRNAEFWKWRYLESEGFKYFFFGDVSVTGTIIGRMEQVLADEDRELDKKKVFRIIEIIPPNSQTWNGQVDNSLVELIQSVLQWALEQGCLAADFYCSSTRFEPLMKAVGFKMQEYEENSPICSLALMFQPLKYKTLPINALFRIETRQGELLRQDFYDTYMVKSENDMDRPSICDFENLV
jgi:hypothetical protein